MWGAICGDVIGSIYEINPVKTEEFELFTEWNRATDDTVLTVAVSDAILNGVDYAVKFKEYGRKYPDAGYGGSFMRWLLSDTYEPYWSFGNGSAMRVSPVGIAYDTLEEVLKEAEKSAAVTHNHPEGIKGAQATAAALFMARKGYSREAIKEYVQDKFDYDLERKIEDIRPYYSFNVTCQGSVPEAIISFLESTDYVDAVRKGISLGGDSDTIACIAGSIAHAYYKEIPAEILNRVRDILDERLLYVIDEFNRRFPLE